MENLPAHRARPTFQEPFNIPGELAVAAMTADETK